MPADAPHDAPGAKLWPRIAFMAVLAVLSSLTNTILLIVAVLQLLWIAVSRQPNDRLAAFGARFAQWKADVIRYQTCVTEEKPFPWADFPEAR
jgi:hypothetical protein